MEPVFIINIGLLWIIVVINLLLTIALIRRLNTPGDTGDSAFTVETLPIGSMAPSFGAETLSGEKVALANYANRKTVLVFVSPTCSHCRPHIPEIEALQVKAKRQGIDLVLVSDSGLEAAQAYAQEMNITMPMLAASRETNTFLTDYKIGGVPMYTIIDEGGRIKGGGLFGDQLWNLTIEKW